MQPALLAKLVNPTGTAVCHAVAVRAAGTCHHALTQDVALHAHKHSYRLSLCTRPTQLRIMHELCELHGLQRHAISPELQQQAHTPHNHAHLDVQLCLLLFRLPTDRMTLHKPPCADPNPLPGTTTLLHTNARSHGLQMDHITLLAQFATQTNGDTTFATARHGWCGHTYALCNSV